MEKERQDRIQWLDMLRAISILLVVLCHCTQGVFDFSIDAMTAAPVNHQITICFLFTLGRMAVPFFLMMTGFLLLDKRYSNQNCERFWKKKWLPLLICTEFWFILYDLLLSGLGYEDFDLLEIVEDVFFLRSISMTHVWYMPALLGLYVLIPFAANAISDFRPRELLFPSIIFSFFAFAFPIIQVIEACNGDYDLSLQFSLGFSGGAYGLYMLYGYLIKKDTLKNIPSFAFVITGILGIVLCVCLQLYNYDHQNVYDLWYDCGFLALSCVSFFEVCSRTKKGILLPAVHILSRYSFAIYLIHNIFRSLLVVKVTTLPINDYLQLTILFTLTLATTLPTIYLIEKIPVFGKKILYIRY